MSPQMMARDFIPSSRAITLGGKVASRRGQTIIGVSETNAVQGYYFTLTTYGIAVIESGKIIFAGDALTTDNEGRAIPAQECQQGTFAYALESASCAGELIEILLNG